MKNIIDNIVFVKNKTPIVRGIENQIHTPKS